MRCRQTPTFLMYMLFISAVFFSAALLLYTYFSVQLQSCINHGSLPHIGCIPNNHHPQVLSSLEVSTGHIDSSKNCSLIASHEKQKDISNINSLPLIDFKDLGNKKQNVLLLIIVSTAPQRFDRRQAIRDTWWKHCTGDKSLDLLTFEEKPCTTMRTGMIRSTTDGGHTTLEVCSKKQWKPYFPQCNPLKGCYNNPVADLIGHWRMDEQTGTEVADDSGYENHGSASGAPIPKLSKFSRGRFFDGSTGQITVPNTAILNFGTSSFSVTGWLKILDLTYPLTTFAVRKGFGCYFGPGRSGWLPGWETAHGGQAKGMHVCIRDKTNRMVSKVITFDNGYQPAQTLGQWVHHAVVFDREQQKKVFVYINGKKQSNTLDISSVQGSVDNTKPLEFGTLYGWKTKGTLDEYRLYNTALDKNEVAAIYKNHLV